MTARGRKRWIMAGAGALFLLGPVACNLPLIGSDMILHPPHRQVAASPPLMCGDVTFKGDGVSLKGWRGEGAGVRKGTLIYLHGFADNRASGAGVIDRFRKRGFNVLAYDSRAHGESGGDACTYGYFEKEDLMRVMDTVSPGPIVLLGSSLGAAVALQVAAVDRRVSAVVAAESFSDLQTAVTERAPFFISTGMIGKAIKRAEQDGKFKMSAVSPEMAARTITAPVLLIHGAVDSETPPDHSRRVFAALPGSKTLILVPDAGHNESLRATIWKDIEHWIDTAIGPSPSK